MLIRTAALEAIRAGTVDTAFRAWAHPRVGVGTHLRTPVGLVEVTAVERTSTDAISEADARRAGTTLDQLLAFLGERPDHPVFRIGLRYAGADPRIELRENADLSADDRAATIARLERMDRAAHGRRWTADTLAIISRRPGIRAKDLATELRTETAALKRNIRKLKELGLTESLEVGYRLSPRGHTFLTPPTSSRTPAD